MSGRETKNAKDRRQSRADTVAGLLRAIDRTLAAAQEVRRHRDRLMRLAKSPRAADGDAERHEPEAGRG